MHGRIYLRLFLAYLWILAGSPAAFASHIVGGEFSYVCRNSSTDTNYIRYEITYKLYMDCINGLPGAIAEEDRAVFVLYGADNKKFVDSFAVFKSSGQRIPAEFKNECINNPPNTCLLMNTYHFTVEVPRREGGYDLTINNCCRNATIVNILRPDQTGASYFTHLPSRATPSQPVSGIDNNSAVFKQLPPQIICVNNPFFYDHSAIDPDGDSLTYEFGQAFDAQKIINNNNSVLVVSSPPPYDPVNYGFGFSAKKPMAGNPPLSINSQTGMISGTPNLQGRYVVAVYCHEWRNGVLINTVIREFQFEVTNCSKAVVANIPQYSDEFNTYVVECKDFEVDFVNLSTGGFNYFWDFGLPDGGATSNEFEPSFTYPDTGVYQVKLVVNRGSTCPDSIMRLVKIYPSFMSNFEVSGLHCPNADLTFTDTSISTTQPVNTWIWSFGDGDSANGRFPVHSFDSGGIYNVTLITRNPKGCTDTVRKEVEIERFTPFAGNDTIIVKGEIIQFNARGGEIYAWTPSTNLSDPNIGNPIGNYPDTGHFDYSVYIKSSFGCEGEDSIKVWVVNQSAIFVPSAFTPNGDGLNDILKPMGIGYFNINYFRVYNRWGQQVFYTTAFNEGWDGKLNGTPQDIGTYFWILSMTNRFGAEEIIKGDAVLLR